MSNKINVLIFPAGEINAVELHDALSTSVNLKVFGASSVERHGSYIFENYISNVPLITDSSFIKTFNSLLKEHQIDIIFPTHDSVATYLVDNRDVLHARVAAADKHTADICRDKKITYQHFSKEDFIPKVYSNPDSIRYPAFMKPRIGQGSVGAQLIHSPKDITTLDWDKNLICEYLPGLEYTVDCLTDLNGALRVISPRSRDRTLAGVSVAAKIQPLTDEIKSIAEAINEKLSFSGLWFFQIKKDSDDIFKLLEISTRCAGTMALTRVSGANLPLLSVYTIMGYEVEPILNKYPIQLDRTLINRYKIEYEYRVVYLDYDDTLIVRGKVNLQVIRFIYQCKNNGIQIHLITKHAGVIRDSLESYGININLFQSIIHIDESDHKIDNINPENAIFIDNSFQERRYVHNKYKIPVFDVDAVESLLDWRS